MSGATVFIFLLDQLPGFQNTLNSTLHWLNKNEDVPFRSSLIQKCNPIVAQSMLNLNKYDIEPTIYNKIKSLDKDDHVDDFNDIDTAYKELSPETLYNIGTVFDNSTEDSDNVNSLEISRKHFTNNNSMTNPDEKIESDIGNEINDFNYTSSENKNDQVKFPVIVPFLVAIFETLSNVTAQTCGGTLVSPHWVLTAASCVDVMTHLYSNSDRTKLSAVNASVYTVVVGSVNPFFHGTGHRVTKLSLLPNVIDDNKISNKSANWTATDNGNNLPSLAMLRIDPAASIRFLPKSHNQSEGVADVQVYGWIVTKNKTGHEMITAASFPAKTMGSEECRVYYKFSNNDSIICLIPQNNSTSKVHKMNSGGPVLLEKNGELLLLGVAQLHRSGPSVVYPLSTHVASINTILHSNQPDTKRK